MVDNFALFVSQLMMIVVLWKCFATEESGEAVPRRRIAPGRRRRGSEGGKDAGSGSDNDPAE